MKFNKNQHLTIASMGKLFSVTAIFTDDNKANAYMKTHSDEACIADFKKGDEKFIFIAEIYGITQKSLQAKLNQIEKLVEKKLEECREWDMPAYPTLKAIKEMLK
jgi:hypothetical protein